MFQKRISVIIPVFNVELYLDRCIQSVVQQQYDNLEIILIDDGSEDKSPQICDNWAKLDSRIQVIHKKNGGLSDARNAGLKVATGDYIAFVDSDDWISKDMYLKLINVIENTDCEIVGCEFIRTNDENRIDIEKKYDKRIILNGSDIIRKLINDEISQVVWNKIYKKSVVEDILFELGKYHEDEFWSYQVLARAKQLVLIGDIGYFYWQRAESIMGEKYSLKRLDVIEAKCNRQKYLEKNMPELVLEGKKNILFTCLYHGQLVVNCLNIEDQQIAIKELKDVVQSIKFNNKEWESISLKDKIWITCTRKSFVKTCKLRNMLKIGC